MKAEIFALCDFASAEPSGKMNIIGVFDHMNALQAPIVWPLCAVAAKIRTDRFEEGTKRIQILFVDADGKVVMPTLEVQAQIRIGPGESTATLQFVVIMPQLKLPNFGEYALDLRVDGVSLAAIPLYVRQIQTPTQPGNPQ